MWLEALLHSCLKTEKCARGRRGYYAELERLQYDIHYIRESYHCDGYRYRGTLGRALRPDINRYVMIFLHEHFEMSKLW